MSTALTTDSQIATRILSYVIQTRRYGHVYVHAGVRRAVAGWQGVTVQGVKFTFRGFGRSLQKGGHKYKAHANYEDTGKPVPTKALREMAF